MMQVMNSKCQRRKNTSASNSNRVRVRENNRKHKEFVQGLSTKIYVPAFTAWRISTIHKGTFTKEQHGLRKTKVHNSNSQSSKQEIAQSQWSLQALGDHKDHSFITFYSIEYEIKLKELVREKIQLK